VNDPVDNRGRDVVELLRIIEAGTIDMRDLTRVTRKTLHVVRPGPPPQELLGFVDWVSGRRKP
jgi:hypothetical protein